MSGAGSEGVKLLGTLDVSCCGVDPNVAWMGGGVKRRRWGR